MSTTREPEPTAPPGLRPARRGPAPLNHRSRRSALSRPAEISGHRSTAVAQKALTATAFIITVILPVLVIAARAGLLSRRRLRRSRTWVDEEAGRATREHGHA